MTRPSRPRGLHLTQKLTTLDGRPAASAYVVVALLMALAATAGYTVAPGG